MGDRCSFWILTKGDSLKVIVTNIRAEDRMFVWFYEFRSGSNLRDIASKLEHVLREKWPTLAPTKARNDVDFGSVAVARSRSRRGVGTVEIFRAGGSRGILLEEIPGTGFGLILWPRTVVGRRASGGATQSQHTASANNTSGGRFRAIVDSSRRRLGRK
jgi:hypothetical protein